jgi:two-component system NtrC family sensor kinase
VDGARDGLRRLLGRGDAAVALREDRDRLAAELSRRLVELHSLQELSHVLSASPRFDHVVAEAARYAMHVVDGSGAVLLLASRDGRSFDAVAATGALGHTLRRRVDPESGGMLMDALRYERLERRQADAQPLVLFGDVEVSSAVAAPLRAHGVSIGALAVADKRAGAFSAEDGRLLSTVATHAAVVLTNAQLFEQIRSGKEQWEATFDALTEGITLVDAGGGIRRANRAVAAMTGATIQAVIGRNLSGSLFGDDAALAPLLEAARRGARPPALVRRSEPLSRMFRVTAAPLANPAEDAVAVVVVEDITEQKALETQLIQSEKLASVGTLVSGVAHELNNPLTSIAGLSEFLLEQYTGADAEREHLRVINDQAERASRIVRNLLTFARKGPAEGAPVDLADVVQRTVLLMGYEMRQAGVTVETAIAPGVPAVHGNRDQLQQVVLNLLINARQALANLADGAPRGILISLDADGDRVVLRVRDSGPGMTPEVAAQVFDPFFTTKAPGEGTGLGLFLSFGIAESHGGTLAVETEPGHGATFVLALPAGGEGEGEGEGVGEPGAAPRRRSEPAARRSGGAPQPARRGKRILVVDDDPAVRRLVTALFAHEGHQVDATGDGDEGLALAAQAPYDLVLTDRRMPAGPTTFVAALLQAHPDWGRRTIVSTSDPRVVAQYADRHPMLVKPFNLKDLRSAAAAALGEQT